jgi:hypothetical protein
MERRKSPESQIMLEQLIRKLGVTLAAGNPTVKTTAPAYISHDDAWSISVSEGLVCSLMYHGKTNN